jgi:diguanylate cyclase (GGDEF)-like protein
MWHSPQASYANKNPNLMSGPNLRWIRALPLLIIALIALVAVGSAFDTTFDTLMGPQQARSRSALANLRLAEVTLLDTENGMQAYLTGRRIEDLERYLLGIRVFTDTITPFLPKLDVLARSTASGPLSSASQDFEDLRTDWGSLAHHDGGDQPTVETAPIMVHTQQLLNRLKGSIESYIRQLSINLALSDEWSGTEQRLLAYFNLGCAVLAVIAMAYAFRSILRALDSGFLARRQVEQLFFMADMLQSAAGQDDTNEVLRSTSASLLPGFGGALYVFNNSRDRLDLSTFWGDFGEGIANSISPTSCWALKRGKSHLNQGEEGTLRCDHAKPGQATLEIPMAARGQLYGLLVVNAEGVDAVQRLDQIKLVATAMGDAMSLALSSIDLRERLRNLALRDSLTNLYNRRFLEEMLERLCADAERRNTSVSAIMMDLDHFKNLNDQHGHAGGDAALREVASAVLSCLRSVDIACRYGGEEFAILLPDCSLAAATAKAEQIRSRINERTTASGTPATVSLGVASIPETCGGQPELLPAADAALYVAKQQGRDRVIVAPPRPSAKKLSLIDTTPQSTVS